MLHIGLSAGDFNVNAKNLLSDSCLTVNLTAINTIMSLLFY